MIVIANISISASAVAASLRNPYPVQQVSYQQYYQTQMPVQMPYAAPQTYANGWKCPKCGKSNPEYLTTCGCGEAKPIEFSTK